MPPLTRPQGIQIGQIGQVSRVSPRADDAGLGSILKQAAATEFSAGQQQVNTGNEMTGFGTAQTAAGLELMKPFKQIRDSREALMADDIAITAKKALRSTVATLESSGASADTWGTEYNSSFTKIHDEALIEAQKISPAAMTHVFKELQSENLSLFTSLTTKALGRNVEDQIGILERKEDFELTEASAARDPAKRLAHKQSYLDALDKAAFNRVITPAVAEQKRAHFEKRLLKNTIIQHAIEKGLTETRTMIDSLPGIDDMQKAELRNVAEHEVRFKVKEVEKTEHAIEKQQKVDQSVAFSTIRGNIMKADAATLLTLIHKIPDYQATGVLGSDGDQLIGYAESRLKDLEKPNPEEDVAEIVNDLTYRIVSNPGSVPDHYLFSVRGLSTATRARLESLQKDRKSQGGYKDIPAYTDSIKLFNSLDSNKVQVFNFPTIGTTSAGSGLGELIVRAVIAYDNEIETRSSRLGRRLNSEEIHLLDGYRDELIKKVKDGVWPASGKSLDDLIK